jgi:hypothetical protein
MSFQSMGCHRTNITQLVDNFTSSDEMHKMFSSKHNIECFANDTMLVQIRSLSRTKNETSR